MAGLAKRLLDWSLALMLLVLLMPVMLAVSIAVLVVMGRPVLFRQVRPGRYGKPFVLYKFRTMLGTKGPGGVELPDADRLTPLGNFLRSTSLDELPELFNILRGDMSLVGPRPLLVEYLALYSPEQARRHEVRPGLTGWAQINGRNAISWGRKFEFDVWYVDHQSFWLDIRILLTTVLKVLRRESISQEGEATIRPFCGSCSSSSQDDQEVRV